MGVKKVGAKSREGVLSWLKLRKCRGNHLLSRLKKYRKNRTLHWKRGDEESEGKKGDPVGERGGEIDGSGTDEGHSFCILRGNWGGGNRSLRIEGQDGPCRVLKKKRGGKSPKGEASKRGPQKEG